MSDDLSCSILPLAVFVTASYYYLLLKGEIKDDKKVSSSHGVTLLARKHCGSNFLHALIIACFIKINS